MKIIDAHLHFCDWPEFDQLARMAHHENTAAHLAGEYSRLGIVRGIVMSNRTLDPKGLVYPDFLSYCVGLDRFVMEKSGIEEEAALVEENLKLRNCVGIKLYPGYNPFYVYEPFMEPFYRLAEKYDKPVAIHTGLTATNNALLKYSHPMTLDEAATKYPKVRFVMCHIGNPWLHDAIGVMEKNPNIVCDLSGLLEHKIPDIEDFFRRKRFYIDQLTGWLEYLDSWDRVMFGTDWPLANLSDYIAFTREMIPEERHEQVFGKNAARIYLGKEAI